VKVRPFYVQLNKEAVETVSKSPVSVNAEFGRDQINEQVLGQPNTCTHRDKINKALLTTKKIILGVFVQHFDTDNL